MNIDTESSEIISVQNSENESFKDILNDIWDSLGTYRIMLYQYEQDDENDDPSEYLQDLLDGIRDIYEEASEIISVQNSENESNKEILNDIWDGLGTYRIMLYQYEQDDENDDPSEYLQDLLDWIWDIYEEA